MQKICFQLNGEKAEAEIEDYLTLLEVLRDRFSILSVKEGCGIGECGACTVLLNERPVYACLTLAVKADGCDVKTTEYLSKDGTLHPLQEAFVKSGAVQCGYCTPGMLMSAYALLQEEKTPTEEMIREGISGNLCRCTGYIQIMEAVKDASQI
ncbi:MAG: (2Fe-2S)-binding protein [Deltaproteobacteria bacterium CG_4_8_14_3_um_filter_51_11]|nr:(2Fe-2S)-binding protein [bacterium]OIP38623.1 MAG: (2Fe-2S)-binding protein [Desulfobacteraceae bacterium CG2_30_51_40]PIP45386.1 MAG: (2Fe-2S)-binding protein [Deltaproteobacteria bacterium CG23_combo_of_CG06-09_8_20_14_all_51_20]PIX20557.1 MAG: (2Fe-2S)-binding protein [Deltaproteobacteria bacterium CG_4_8_14_3_um_filter_51_11]PIY22673.1 MAG: (2Fe-2S)-binding protein [Deltaproteobacteria bacterium CG_4_10_14_3_um_filter_51_14]PJB36916.1 MAG: (2Fe-2S)-binding protein [Deltaproteobacteria 